MATVGTGKYTYDVIENWGKLPAGDTFGMVSAIATDSQERVFAFQRKDPPFRLHDFHDHRGTARGTPGPRSTRLGWEISPSATWTRHKVSKGTRYFQSVSSGLS